jgi:hypothetical protein
MASIARLSDARTGDRNCILFANPNKRVLKDQQFHTEALTLARLDPGWFSGDPKTPRREIRVVLPSLET